MPPQRLPVSLDEFPSPNSLALVILCVDDEERLLALRKIVLEEAGYKVYTATTVEQGLEICRDRHVHLILTDHQLKIGSGRDLALRVRRFNHGVPVAIYSALLQKPEDSEYADAFISKSTGMTDVLVAVASLLKL